LLIVLGLFAALIPAAALANGSSAGDNQYVDPLSGVHSGNSSSSSSSSASGTAGTSATAATTATTTTPTATTAGTTSTAASRKSKTLPFTGFDDWQAAGLGVLLMVGGLGLRRRPQGRRPQA
jgi:hypothetical protein